MEKSVKRHVTEIHTMKKIYTHTKPCTRRKVPPKSDASPKVRPVAAACQPQPKFDFTKLAESIIADSDAKATLTEVVAKKPQRNCIVKGKHCIIQSRPKYNTPLVYVTYASLSTKFRCNRLEKIINKIKDLKNHKKIRLEKIVKKLKRKNYYHSYYQPKKCL